MSCCLKSYAKAVQYTANCLNRSTIQFIQYTVEISDYQAWYIR